MVDSQCCVSFGRAYMLSYSVMSDSVTPWTVAHQAPPAMEFSRQEYWSGVPFPSPGDLPDPGIELLHQWVDSLPPEPPGKLEQTFPLSIQKEPILLIP